MSIGDPLIHLTIDGQEIAVPATKTAYDPLFKKKVEIPTTIYDAVLALSEQTGMPNPIPILCHREHINPVAVCRVCVVDVGGRVLAPACYRPVEPKLDVKTSVTSERVRTSVKTLIQLLMADHPTPCERQRLHGDCELELLARRVGAQQSPFSKPAIPKKHDESSRSITTLASFVIVVSEHATISAIIR